MADQTFEERAEVTMEAIYRHVVGVYDRDPSMLREKLRQLEPWLVKVFQAAADRPLRDGPRLDGRFIGLFRHAVKLVERRAWPHATHFLFKGTPEIGVDMEWATKHQPHVAEAVAKLLAGTIADLDYCAPLEMAKPRDETSVEEPSPLKRFLEALALIAERAAKDF